MDATEQAARPWQSHERNYSGNRVGVREDGEWIILNVLSGGVETTTSIRPHEAWDLAQRLSPAWHARYLEVFAENRKLRDAVYEFTYQETAADLLERIASEIDCGADCDRGHREHDTNAFVCSGEDECESFKACQLRDFAAAIRARAAITKAEA